ncbi:MAG TPA: PD-(D/E)XK nuclease family protein [Egibacteraceae bacterium]|nr:PD-(D/E)XK nuclease family protein [Egibacteraceae bacterium]
MSSATLPLTPLPAAPLAPDGPADPAGPAPLVLSFSRVDMFGTCPLKYRFAYVDALPSQPGPHLSWGSSIHAALEAWWDQKLPEPPDVQVLLDALYEHWDDSGFEGMEREEKVRWYRHAQDVLRRHHQRYSPGYTPAVATEQWFEVEVGNAVTVVGSIDHVARTAGGGIGIVDWKTNRKAKTRAHVAGSLQLAVYALAARHLWGIDPDWVALDFVVPGVRVTVERSDIDVDAAVRQIHEVAEGIRAEQFAPTPNSLCNWCDYRAECPAFTGDGPDVAGTALVELRRLRRRTERDAARIATLESVVRDRLGEAAL